MKTETAIDYINKRLFPDLTEESIKNKTGHTWKDVLELMDDYLIYKFRVIEIYTPERIKELFDNYKRELLTKIYHAHSRDVVLSTEMPITNI